MKMTSFTLTGQQRHALRRRVRETLRRLRANSAIITFVAVFVLVFLFYCGATGPYQRQREDRASDVSSPLSSKNVATRHHLPRDDPGDFGSVASGHVPRNSYPTPEALQTFIEAAVTYLVRANNPEGDGSFTYEYRLRDGLLGKGSGYNTLRHAGAIYALADACHRPDSAHMPHCAGVNGTVVRAAKWLLRNTVAPIPSSSGNGLRVAQGTSHKLYGVWSKPSIESSRSRHSSAELGEVRLGGIGLGLITLTTAEAVEPGLIPPDVLTGLGRLTTDVMQKPNGLFFSYYRADGDGPDEHRTSLYFPGEAALGLIYLYHHSGDMTFLEAAVRALEALYRLRRPLPSEDVPCDHWALIATAKVFRTPAFHASSFSSRQRRALVDSARRMALACHYRDVKRTPEDQVFSSSFATGLEGMLGVLPLLSTYFDPSAALDLAGSDIRDILCLARRTVGSLIAVQHGVGGNEAISDGKGAMSVKLLRGAIPGSAQLSVASHSPPMRRVTGDNGVFRVDTTQHALSSVLSYVRATAYPNLHRIKCSNEGQPVRVFRM